MVTLAEARAHLAMTDDLGTEDDPMIVQMIEAATQHLASIGIDMAQEPLPAPLHQAALMIVSLLYDRRDTADELKFGPVIFRLIAPYREIAL